MYLILVTFKVTEPMQVEWYNTETVYRGLKLDVLVYVLASLLVYKAFRILDELKLRPEETKERQLVPY